MNEEKLNRYGIYARNTKTDKPKCTGLYASSEEKAKTLAEQLLGPDYIVLDVYKM